MKTVWKITLSEQGMQWTKQSSNRSLCFKSNNCILHSSVVLIKMEAVECHSPSADSSETFTGDQSNRFTLSATRKDVPTIIYSGENYDQEARRFPEKDTSPIANNNNH